MLDMGELNDLPLGDIEICIDGRFCIKAEFVPDGERHTISCIIKSHIPSDKDGVESGERFEVKSFYKGHSKLSIGMEGETGYFADGTRAFDTYDYDTEYLDNGVQYVITGNTKVSTYVCCGQTYKWSKSGHLLVNIEHYLKK